MPNNSGNFLTAPRLSLVCFVRDIEHVMFLHTTLGRKVLTSSKIKGLIYGFFHSIFMTLEVRFQCPIFQIVSILIEPLMVPHKYFLLYLQLFPCCIIICCPSCVPNLGTSGGWQYCQLGDGIKQGSENGRYKEIRKERGHTFLSLKKFMAERKAK
jgi:hypothetical protein